jgi:hypothetical protein
MRRPRTRPAPLAAHGVPFGLRTIDSSASESRPVESVNRQASIFSAIVATPAPTESSIRRVSKRRWRADSSTPPAYAHAQAVNAGRVGDRSILPTIGFLRAT